jgi:hypothetical protein
VDKDVASYLATVGSEVRRRDAATMVELLRRVTGLEPAMWSNIVAFGTYHYEYASGRSGDAPAAGFAARKAATTVYVTDGFDQYTKLLDELGPHTTGKSCLYLKDLSKVDLDVLERLLSASYATVSAPGFAAPAD